MNAIELIQSFKFPKDTLVNHRVPKKLLIEHGFPTTADKSHINKGIEELVWVATLKPSTVGLAAYIGKKNEILEIAVLQMKLHPEGKRKRLVELVHRAISYPIILITIQESSLFLSLANIRCSENETGKTVIDGEIIEAHLDDSLDIDIYASFRHALALPLQPLNSLYDLYEGWINTVLALNVARLKGVFNMPVSYKHATTRRESLKKTFFLSEMISKLHAVAVKEKQMSKQVELNLKIRHLQNEYKTVCESL